MKSVYIQDEIKAGEKLLVIPALRWDYHDQFGSEVTAKLGATYSMNANNRIKFNVGTGYRAPTLYELYADMKKSMGGMSVNVVGNPDLQPEKSFDIDIAFEGEAGTAGSADGLPLGLARAVRTRGGGARQLDARAAGL